MIAADAAGIFQQMLGLNTTPALEYYPDEATMVAAFQQNYSKIAGYLFVIKLTLSLDVTMYYLEMKWLILVIDLYRFDPDKSANHEQWNTSIPTAIISPILAMFLFIPYMEIHIVLTTPQNHTSARCLKK